MMTGTSVPGTVIRVSVDRQVVGEITFSPDNHLTSSGKAKEKERYPVSGPLKRMLGKRVASAVILLVMHRFTKQDQDFGSFVYQPRSSDGRPAGQARRYHFATAASEEATSVPAKKKVVHKHLKQAV